MAATVSAWGKPGAWALESEEQEAELKSQQQQPDPSADFPSLAAAATTKPKKKKGQTVSLAEFTTYGGPKSSAQPKQGLTHEDLVNLPTGPRERTAEELEGARRGGLGGGFRNYGDRNPRYSNGEDSSSRWGSSKSSDEPRRSGSGFGRESGRELVSSRADEIDDWGAAKKSVVGNGFDRKERGFFSDSQSSKADESDSWVTNKTFVPSLEGRRFGATGGGIERERRGGGFTSNGGGADSDNWGKKKEEMGSNGGFDRERRGGFSSNGGGADSDNWGKKKEEGNGGGSVIGERPRLNLQPRTVHVSVETVKPKGSNPFGAARPREEVLAEKGQDWKKIDEQLESSKIKELEKSNGSSFGKRSFGIGNRRSSSGSPERSWRKAAESTEVQPDLTEATHPDSESAENNEDGHNEDN